MGQCTSKFAVAAGAQYRRLTSTFLELRLVKNLTVASMENESELRADQLAPSRE